MSQSQLPGVPNLLLGFNDLSVLRSVIRGYVTYTRRAVPSSQTRDIQLHLLEDVYRRLTGIPPGTLEVHIMLLMPEIHALDCAFRGFADFVRQKVPPSKERDETLRDLEGFRQHLARLLPGFRGPAGE